MLRVLIIIMIAVLLITAAAGIWGYMYLVPQLEQNRAINKSKDNIKTLITLMLTRQMGRPGDTAVGLPHYSGKNLVLSLVATKDLDNRRRENLEILFSPGDKQLSLETTDVSRYKKITKEALETEGAFSDLTSYAGRRNGDDKHRVSLDDLKHGTPLIADLSFEDVVIIGFSDGSVRTLERDDATTALLRQFSDK